MSEPVKLVAVAAKAIKWRGTRYEIGHALPDLTEAEAAELGARVSVSAAVPDPSRAPRPAPAGGQGGTVQPAGETGPGGGAPAGGRSIPPAPNTEGGSSPHGAAGDDAPGGPGAGRASAPSAPAIPPARPDEAADVARAIEAAIGRLDAGDAALWTRDGRPQVTAIEAVLGWGIAAGERDAVWATLRVAGGLQRPEAG